MGLKKAKNITFPLLVCLVEECEERKTREEKRKAMRTIV